jgi:hypothetical protein
MDITGSEPADDFNPHPGSTVKKHLRMRHAAFPGEKQWSEGNEESPARGVREIAACSAYSLDFL